MVVGSRRGVGYKDFVQYWRDMLDIVSCGWHYVAYTKVAEGGKGMDGGGLESLYVETVVDSFS